MSYVTAKRILDVIGAVLLLAATLPLWGLAALALLVAQGPPLLFRQVRVGRDGRLFTLWKFRTMRDGQPPRLPDRPVAKSPADPRVTPIGHLLRRTAVDELPQLLNVLRGEMSLVGPRPLPVEDLEHPSWLSHVSPEERERRLQWMAVRRQVLPGLTGQWQITPHPADDFDNWIACDAAYVARRSLALDMCILLRTPWAVLRGRAPVGTPQATERDE